jgi:thimet oligopeptidase
MTATVTKARRAELQSTSAQAANATKKTAHPVIQNPEDIAKICMLNFDEILINAQTAKDSYANDIDDFLAMPMDDPCQCFRAFETLKARMDHINSLYRAMAKVQTIPSIRKTFENEKEELTKCVLSIASAKGQAIYAKLQSCEHHASLDEGQQYRLSRVMAKMRVLGYHSAHCKKNQEINRQFAEQKEAFNENWKNIREGVQFPKEALKDTPESALSRLKEKSDSYVIPLDVTTYLMMMSSCPNPDVRKALCQAYRNVGYCNYSSIDIAQRNESINNVLRVQNIMRLRQERADLDGVESFADLQASEEVLGSAKNVEQFLLGVLEATKEGQKAQYEVLKKTFPDLLVPGKEKFRSCDSFYLEEQYAQRHYQLNTEQLREYFPLNATMKKMIEFLKTFYGVSMEKVVTPPLWAEGVEVYLVTSIKDPTLRGYVAFDLYARKGKEPHIYYLGIVNGSVLPDGTSAPTFGVVLGNCSVDEKAKQPLLTPREVYACLLHETGHAIQYVLSRKATSVASMSECPSILLEEWGKDLHHLKSLSSHYESGAELDAKTCENWNKMQRFKGARELAEQAFFALIILRCFLKDAKQDLHAIEKEAFELAQPHYEFEELSHRIASLPPVIQGSYYEYPLAIAIARNLLEKIQQEGSSLRFAEEVLTKVGDEDPLKVIEKFLGSDPLSMEALKRAYSPPSDSAAGKEI